MSDRTEQWKIYFETLYRINTGTVKVEDKTWYGAKKIKEVPAMQLLKAVQRKRREQGLIR